MLLNFWDISELTKNFMELYNLNGKQMCNILRRVHSDNEQDNVIIFCEETGIKLDEVDVAHDIEFRGKIVSTTVDDFDYLMQAGLLNLDALLENDSPISRHLKKYNIEVKPSTHEFFYNGEKFYIPYNEDCKWCAYGNEQCKYSEKTYKDIWCPYLKAIYTLSTKLYHDKCEIEMFLHGSKEEMLKYSTVINYPEIFDTIETFVKNYFKNDLSIGREWSKIKNKTFIITIPVKYDEISFLGDYISCNDGADANDIFWRYEKFCSETYDYKEQVPKCFWDNLWLIMTCLDLIRSLGETSGTIYAGIKHGVVIPYDRLKIDLI